MAARIRTPIIRVPLREITFLLNPTTGFDLYSVYGHEGVNTVRWSAMWVGKRRKIERIYITMLRANQTKCILKIDILRRKKEKRNKKN